MNSKDSKTRMMVLAVLVVQNCSLILIMRYSRIAGDQTSRYIISTAVLLSEMIKFLVSAMVIYGPHVSSLCSWDEIKRLYRDDFYDNRIELLKLCVPSGLYVVQNNLQYLAASNLPVSIFQVLSQLKIVTTAIFSVTMLSRKLSGPQWVSILALTLGVALVQYSQHQDGSGPDSDSLFGIICVLFSCVTSGFSGVYFEKVLKSGKLPLWMRNMHLSMIGFILAADLEAISTEGFFRGYNAIVWLVILLQAGGGLVVASVVMYADNVLKGFATSFSVVISCVVSSLFLEASDINILFVLGATTVVSAAFAYSIYPSTSVAPSIPLHLKLPSGEDLVELEAQIADDGKKGKRTPKTPKKGGKSPLDTNGTQETTRNRHDGTSVFKN